jgi:maltose O-acetyltransferase
MTEKQKMFAGDLYRSTDPELVAEMNHAQKFLRELNAIPNEEPEKRFAHLEKLFGHIGQNTQIRSPFFCDYGRQISIGRDTFANFNCVFLDCNQITIGDYAQIGPRRSHLQGLASRRSCSPQKRVGSGVAGQNRSQRLDRRRRHHLS